MIERFDLKTRFLWLAALSLIFTPYTSAFAQVPTPGGWDFTFDGGFASQTDVDLDGDSDSFGMDRMFYSAAVAYRWNYRNSVGLSVGTGTSDYDFEDSGGEMTAQPWDEIDEFRVSAPMRFALGDTSTIFAIPTLRYNGEDSASSSDSRTWGFLGGVAWRLDEKLTIGPGLGVFSRLEGSTRVFPILLIDWKIAERWSLSTGSGLASSQGPGLALNYQLSDHWTLGLAGRYEEVQFRLGDESAAPGGVGEDMALPMVFTAAWNPNESVRIGLFAGVKLGGELTLFDETGKTIESRGYGAAPVMGATIEFRL